MEWVKGAMDVQAQEAAGDWQREGPEESRKEGQESFKVGKSHDRLSFS